MARPYIQWDPDLLRGKATAAIHGPVAIGSSTDLALLVDLFARLALPVVPPDVRVGYQHDETAQAGGPTDPARGFGRSVPDLMPSGIAFFGADPVHGEPLPSDLCDPILGAAYPHALLGWRAPLRGWSGSRAEGNFQGEWRLRWGDPEIRAPGATRGAWTGLVLSLYHAGVRAVQHLLVVAHGKRRHDGSWSYLAAYVDDPLTPGPATVTTAVADGLDQGYVRVVIAGASPWTVNLEYGDGVTWTPLLAAPVDFLAYVAPGDEGEVALVAAPLLAAAEVQPGVPGSYPLRDQWVDDLVVPAFAPWVPDIADWSARDWQERLFGAPPPLVYDPSLRQPRADLLLMPGGSVAAPAEAPVYVDGFGAGTRFAATSHAFVAGNADARLAAPPTPPLSRVLPLAACDKNLGGRDAPFAVALEILPEGMSGWPAPARIWAVGDAVTDPPGPLAGLGLYYNAGRLYARACNATLGVWVETFVDFDPAVYEARGTVVALAWTGAAGGLVGRPNYELRVVVDGVASAAVRVANFMCTGSEESTVGSPLPDGTAAGFAGVLGRVAWFADAVADADLGPAAFDVPGAGFLNPSFEDASASERPGEAAYWEWRSLQTDGAWAEYNATDPGLDRWRGAGEGFEAGWNGNEGWVDDLVVTALAAALFNAASPTYYGTTESFEIWGYRDDSVVPVVPYPGPNWLDAPTYVAPCEEVPPTGFAGWYDALMGTHVAPLAIEGFEEAWGTDPLSAAGQPWWPGTAPDGVLRGAPLSFPVVVPPDRNAVLLYRDLDASVHRLAIPAATYGSAVALAAAFDAALAGALGPGRLVVCAAYTSAQGDGLDLRWDGATLGAESVWLGIAESERWNDVRPLLGLAALGPGGRQGAVRYPRHLLPAPPPGYAVDEVFLFDPWSLLDFYTAFDANCGGWFAIPYGMLGALFDSALGPGTFVEMYTLAGWVGPTAVWIADYAPGDLTPAMFDAGTTNRETFVDTLWPNWLWT